MKKKRPVLLGYFKPKSINFLPPILLLSISFDALTQSSLKTIPNTVAVHQQIIASAGGITKFKNIELTWTLGEAFIGEVIDKNRLYTVGFHQPIIIQAVSANNEDLTDEIMVFPNPFGSSLNVKFKLENEENSGSYKLVLSDLLGKQILEKTIDSNDPNTTVDLPEISSGSYQIKVYNLKQGLFRTFKMIKEN